MCGGLEPPVAVGASQVSQWTPLLKPAIHAHLDITVDVPAEETIVIIRKCFKVNKKKLLHRSNEGFLLRLNVKLGGVIMECVVGSGFKLKCYLTYGNKSDLIGK